MRGRHVLARDGFKIEDIDCVLRSFDQYIALWCPNHRVRQLRWSFHAVGLDRARSNEWTRCKVLKKPPAAAVNDWRRHVRPPSATTSHLISILGPVFESGNGRGRRLNSLRL